MSGLFAGYHHLDTGETAPTAADSPAPALLPERNQAALVIPPAPAAPQAQAERLKRLAKPGQSVTVIGDAVRAGKSKQAIGGAFEAALLS